MKNSHITQIARIRKENKVIFTKEMLEGLNLKNPPTTNILDFTFMCNGRITKDFYKYIIAHFDSLEMYLYAIFIPTVRVSDHNDWMPIKIEGCTHCGNKLRLEALSSKEQTEIWIKARDYDHWLPPIVPTSELEGNECYKIWCHALGVKDINEYRNKPVPSYSEAKELFPDGLNWVHIKIG